MSIFNIRFIYICFYLRKTNKCKKNKKNKQTKKKQKKNKQTNLKTDKTCIISTLVFLGLGISLRYACFLSEFYPQHKAVLLDILT